MIQALALFGNLFMEKIGLKRYHRSEAVTRVTRGEKNSHKFWKKKPNSCQAK
jgi:hypothetical protein